MVPVVLRFCIWQLEGHSQRLRKGTLLELKRHHAARRVFSEILAVVIRVHSLPVSLVKQLDKMHCVPSPFCTEVGNPNLSLSAHSTGVRAGLGADATLTPLQRGLSHLHLPISSPVLLSPDRNVAPQSEGMA